LRLRAKDLALMCVFAAVYSVLSAVSLFPVIGAVGRFITLAAVMAPLIGMMLGPYVGAAAVSIGGLIGWSITQTGAFGFLSFVPGASTALCSGLLYNGKRSPSLALYVMLFLPMAFYPTIGSVWLYPYYLWFQLIGLIVLASPLSSRARKSMRNPGHLSKLGFGVGVISFATTLFGQIVGTLMFEVMYWPLLIPQIEAWRTNWQMVTFTYPVERAIITLIAAVIGTPLIKALRTYGFQVGEPNHEN